jgi:hypothetical protein
MGGNISYPLAGSNPVIIRRIAVITRSVSQVLVIWQTRYKNEFLTGKKRGRIGHPIIGIPAILARRLEKPDQILLISGIHLGDC